MDWFYIHRKELLKLGITENNFFRNIGIVQSIFNTEWISKQERKFNKHPLVNRSMEPLFNRHPVYQAFHSSTIENAIYLYHLGECFFSLSNTENINTYIPRLKSENEIKSAFFELLMWKSLMENWFHIFWLQIKNNLGNPVELVIEKKSIRYWVECKSTYNKPFQDDFLERIISTINEVMKWKSKKILLKMTIESEIADLYSTNKKLLKDLRELVLKIYNLSEKKFPIWFYNKGESSDIKWKLEAYLFDDISEKEVSSFIINECDKWCAHGKARKSSSNTGLPDLSMPTDFTWIFWVKYIYWDYSKKNQIRITKICEQIYEKIKQQRNLLKNWEKVIIIFDEDIIENNDINSIEKALIIDDENLVILIACKEKSLFKYNLKPIYIGNSIKKDIF